MVDLLVIALLVGAAALGWQRGLAMALVSGCAFLLVGLPVAAIAVAVGSPPPMAAFVLGGLIGVVPVVLRGTAITARVDELLGDHGRLANRIGGAFVATSAALVLAWFVGAVASIVPGESRVLTALRGSAALSALAEGVPPQGSVGSLVLRSGLVPSLNGPLVLAEEPDPASASAAGVLAAQGSVLQVTGEACGQLITGTGWVAGPGLIVTNAHVVAGQTRTALSGGPRYEGFEAVVTAFDPVQDIAVLATSSAVLLPPPLPLALSVQHGEPAAVIGFPLGGERRIVAARIDRVATHDTEPVGGGPAQPVSVLAFRAAVQQGNSGGPVVDERGRALGLVVSKGIGQRVDAAYGVASVDLQAVLSEGARRQPVSTGRCLTADDLVGS